MPLHREAKSNSIKLNWFIAIVDKPQDSQLEGSSAKMTKEENKNTKIRINIIIIMEKCDTENRQCEKKLRGKLVAVNRPDKYRV